MKELFLAVSSPSVLQKDLSWMVSENWFGAREKSGNFFYHDERLQP